MRGRQAILGETLALSAVPFFIFVDFDYKKIFSFMFTNNNKQLQLHLMLVQSAVACVYYFSHEEKQVITPKT